MNQPRAFNRTSQSAFFLPISVSVKQTQTSLCTPFESQLGQLTWAKKKEARTESPTHGLPDGLNFAFKIFTTQSGIKVVSALAFQEHQRKFCGAHALVRKGFALQKTHVPFLRMTQATIIFRHHHQLASCE